MWILRIYLILISVLLLTYLIGWATTADTIWLANSPLRVKGPVICLVLFITFIVGLSDAINRAFKR